MNLKSKINKQMHKTAHIPFFRKKRWWDKKMDNKGVNREMG